MADILISVRPAFAKKILRKTKKFELRRRATRIRPGDRLFIYATSPVKQVVGVCMVRRVFTGSPATVRRHVGVNADLSRSEFEDYAAGAATMSALELSNVKRLLVPVDLDALRRRNSRFVVPQSYRYMTAGESAALTRGPSRQLMAS